MGNENSENNLDYFYGSNKKKVIVRKTLSCYRYSFVVDIFIIY